MVKIRIDDQTVEVKEGTTVLKAAQHVGIEVPHLCYHPAFPPEGTCRICLVEIEGVPKLEPACSTQVRDGMKILTQSEKAIEARKGVLEFLLAEHPMDCPICDQAGECKLQDYYEEYGFFDSQFDEKKEKREKKVKIGKNLIHDKERCVLCRRCVRFLREITHTEEIGVFERGIHTEINIYDSTPVDNNYSGNLAQICPVGAITDLDFRFKTRSWFLESGESICPRCSRGCNIFIESISGFHRFPVQKRVYRIRARENTEVNSQWICDLGRYGYAYLDEERTSQIIKKAESKGEDLSWEKSLLFIADMIKKMHQKKRESQISLALSGWLSNEELFLIKKIFIDDLLVENIYFTDPPLEKGDDFLLTSERSPNRKGAQELGFDLKTLNTNVLSDKTDLLLIFGSNILGDFNLKDVKSALEKINTKIIFTSHNQEINSLFDFVLPVSLFAEKEGSFTNVEGIVQRFSPALQAPGESRPEWSVLVDLGKEVGINSKFYNRFSSPVDIMSEMEKEIPFFEKRSE